MSRLQDLPPDQRAALTLLACKGKSYAEVAALLRIDRAAVESRAHAALSTLGPAPYSRSLPSATRAKIGEYLLGQQGQREARATRRELAADEDAYEWARDVATQLSELPDAHIPELPERDAYDAQPPERDAHDAQPPERDSHDAQPSATPSAQPAERPSRPPQPSAKLPVSRRGGAVVLGVLLGAAIVAVLLLTVAKSGERAVSQAASKSRGNSSSGQASADNGASSTSSNASSTSTPVIERQINLTAPAGGGSATGVAIIASEGERKALVISAEHLPPSKGFTYYVWLLSSKGTPSPHAFEATSVSSSGKGNWITILPRDASSYDRIEMTKQPSVHRSSSKGGESHPKSPSSEVVLEAPFKLA